MLKLFMNELGILWKETVVLGSFRVLRFKVWWKYLQASVGIFVPKTEIWNRSVKDSTVTFTAA
jgi:hypothetical protein